MNIAATPRNRTLLQFFFGKINNEQTVPQLSILESKSHLQKPANIMRKFKIPIRAVLYHLEGKWFAHCLEFDLIGDGTDCHKALESLTGTIAAQIDACIRHNSTESLFCPADAKYFKMFAEGKQITFKQNLPFDREENNNKEVEIERFDAREYTESADTDADLVLAK